MAPPNPLLTAVHTAAADLTKLASDLASDASSANTAERVRKAGEALVAAADAAKSAVSKATPPAGWPRDLASADSTSPAWGLDPSEVARG
jgi:hypothetical protein